MCDNILKTDLPNGIYNMKYKYLSELRDKIHNWKLNRPIDDSRLPSIKKYINKTNRVEGIIYLARTTNGIYYCYDGIHRISSLFSMEDDINSYPDILSCPNQSINDIMILLDVMEYDEEKIKERFININSSMPVPELYVDYQRDKQIRLLIESLYDHFRTNYKDFIKVSKNSKVPNINSTDFNNKMLNVITNSNVQTREIDYWLKLIEDYNDHMSKLEITKNMNSKNKANKNKMEIFRMIRLTESQMKKCKKYNMYVFAASNWDDYLLDYIQNKE